MRNLLYSFLILICFSLSSSGEILVFPDTLEESAYDEEQVQLKWCFIFSNELGYNIDRIGNPELYAAIYNWIGTPYHYSGENHKGIDCSGFVCHVYKEVYDKTLEGSSRDIYQLTNPKPLDELKEGDLVFFKINRRRISHVGIYLGQNKFAHASVKSGVIISDLDESYYAARYYSGGQIVG